MNIGLLSVINNSLKQAVWSLLCSSETSLDTTSVFRKKSMLI